MNRRSNCYVPEEIQREILLRLPVKSLVRFRSVEKRLRHMISTPQFITDHLKTFRCEEDALILLHQGDFNHLLCCLFHDGLIPKHIEDIRLPYRTLRYTHISTVGYCMGIACLICYSHRRSTLEVLFLNLSIKKLVAIPASDHFSLDMSYTRFGFGYVEDDYKLVVLLSTSINGTPLTAKVFSLKTRNWATIACSWPKQQDTQYCKIAGGCAVFIDGACHWLAEEFDSNGRGTKLVLSFYLSGDHKIGKTIAPSNDFNVSIHAYDRRLSLISNCEIWVMNKSGVDTSWTILTEGMHLLGSETGISPTIVGFTCLGGVVYSRRYRKQDRICDELLCYNHQNKTNLSLKIIHEYRISYPDCLYAYRQNLVLLDQGVQIPGELS